MPENKDTHKNSIFAANLKNLMEYYGVKNVELADMLKVKKSAISNYLAGRTPKTDIQSKLAGLFAVSIDALLHSPGMINTTMREDPTHRLIPYIVPVFGNALSTTDDIYQNDNYEDFIRLTFPMHRDNDCYALKIMNDHMASFGIHEHSMVFFAVGTEVKSKSLAAVLLKKEGKIVIRQVTFFKNRMTLSSSVPEDKITCDKDNEDIQILGKVVSVNTPFH